MSEKTYRHEDVALQWRRTKIIATLGPASSSPHVIERLLEAGVDLVRLNMSHGEPDEHRRLVARVRRAAKRLGRHIGMIVDLRGPKIRVGRFAGGGIHLDPGATVTITSRAVIGRDGIIPSQYRRLPRDVRPGQRILLDDGRLQLKVVEVKNSDVLCRVIDGGLLTDNKGMNLPDSNLSSPTLTDKDRRDVKLALELKADFLALSFVRGPADVMRLKRYMKRLGCTLPVISKIERSEALSNIDDIMDCSYAIMIARGDLGIELPAERVPLIQQDLIRCARQRGIPVIVATQMLESMITQPRPTRAEVSDVATAAQLSADAAMLSGETATGKYPVESVATMDRILCEIERHQWRTGSFAPNPIAERGTKTHRIREAMAHAAVELTRDLGLHAIIIPTRTGTTARIMAAHRALAPMVGVCSDRAMCRRLALHWGIVPVSTRESHTRDWRRLCAQVGARCNLGRSGHDVLLVSGFNEDPARNQPVMKILHLK